MTLSLHFRLEAVPDQRKLVYYSREALEVAFGKAGLPGLTVCVIEVAGSWEIEPGQLAI